MLSSGNVVFTARSGSEAALQGKAERAIAEHLGRTFLTIVRPIDALQKLVESDPYEGFRLPAAAKRIVTFLHSAPTSKPALPVEVDGARILCVKGREVFSAYVPSPRGPVFMTLLQKTFGDEVTTRTWDTVKKVVAAR